MSVIAILTFFLFRQVSTWTRVWQVSSEHVATKLAKITSTSQSSVPSSISSLFYYFVDALQSSSAPRQLWSRHSDASYNRVSSSLYPGYHFSQVHPVAHVSEQLSDSTSIYATPTYTGIITKEPSTEKVRMQGCAGCMDPSLPIMFLTRWQIYIVFSARFNKSKHWE